MIYVGFSDETLKKYNNLHPNIHLFGENIHPCKAKEIAQNLNESKIDYILYDTVIMDYIDLNKLMFVKDDLYAVPFKDEFKEELEYIWPGEIILNKCINSN